MAARLAEQVKTALVQFTSETRLYELQLDGADTTVLVEAFAADEGLQTIGQRDLLLLSTDAHLDLSTLLGKQAALQVSLADSTRTRSRT